MWLQNCKVMKAVFDYNEGSVKIYDENDTLIMKRTGLNKLQIKEIENNIKRYGAKKLETTSEPFRFL